MNIDQVKLKGSLTVEMSMIFPIVLLLLFLMLEIGIWYSHQVMVFAAGEEAMLLENMNRKSEAAGSSASGTGQDLTFTVDNYLDAVLSPLDEDGLSWQLTRKTGFLTRETTLVLGGSLSMLQDHPYQISFTSRWADPRRFRDRVDLVLEKLSEEKEKQTD